jgi:hypothetical protein
MVQEPLNRDVAETAETIKKYGVPGGHGAKISTSLPSVRCHLPKLMRRLIFAVVAVVGALLLLEGAARLIIYTGVQVLLPKEVVQWISTQQVVFDPALGWRPASGFTEIEGSDFLRQSTTQMAAQRRPGERRGFAFGDSQTRGAGIPENQAWPGMAERKLREDGSEFRVINMGSIGYRSAQVLRLVEAYVLPLDPDFLVVDCMVNDSVQLPRNYQDGSAWMRGALFESRLYRLLWLGVTTAQGKNTGPMGSLRIEQPTEPGQMKGPGNHQALIELAHTAGIPILFVDYPFLGNPIRSLAPASALPPGAIVVQATEALNQSGYAPEALFLENNHLSLLGSRIVGDVVAEAVRKELRGK